MKVLLSFLLFSFIVIGTVSLACTSQAEKTKVYSLLVAEYEKSVSGNYTHLVSYNFSDGKFVSKDTIYSVLPLREQEQGKQVRFDLGTNFIYQNRYVITGIGNVFDLKTQSLIMEESDEFIEARGDSLIFQRANIFTGTGYLVCNLKKRTYEFVKDPSFFMVKGIHSPNHCHGIEVDYSVLPYKIQLYDNENHSEIIINDCGKGSLQDVISSTLSNVPVHWIDNQHFIYAKYIHSFSPPSTSFAKAEIYKVDIQSRTSELITELDSIPPATSRATFLTDPLDQVIFKCAKGQFVLDLEQKNLSKYRFRSVDHGFSIEIYSDLNYRKSIRFKVGEIGRYEYSYSSARTTYGYIGFEFNESGSQYNRPAGIAVWNSTAESWTNFQIPWISSIVGWAEK
ncbi:hypothetical protein GYB22_12325 [bacterium]|nr:hypothetical protein [bacterium]